MTKHKTGSTKIQDIQDGFALKRTHEKARRIKGGGIKENHVIPPLPAKHILDSYTLSSPSSKRAVRDYVETQAWGESVQHVEKVRSEHLFGRDYNCWDVHTNRDRYWVITVPSNLYSQRYFPSLDFTLSFHVGVTARIMALQTGPPDETQRLRLTAAWRIWEEAAGSYDRGEEAEDFQAVGMKCRECLIELVRTIAKAEMVPVPEQEPKRSDVVEWCGIIANYIAAGSSNESIRGSLKTNAKSTWQLVNWLTHFKNATRFDASFALDATQNVVAAFGSAVIRYESKRPDRCPKCGSYAIDVGYNPDLLPRPYVLECEKCGWQASEDKNTSTSET